MSDTRIEPSWNPKDSMQLYRIKRWGSGFVDVNDSGELVVCPNRELPTSDSICEILNAAKSQGCHLPALLRFPGIIRTRAADINQAFAEAINEFAYQSEYRCIYPVKVNQHHEVVQSVIDANREYGGGLEAGSKAELFAVIAMAEGGMPILCNGFKDQSYVEMAIHAARTGLRLTLIVEKPQEVELIIRLARKFNFCPQLGLRAKLAAQVAGHWQNSSGQSSKFGLTSSELVQVVDRLTSAGLRNQIRLLHFHSGSQINDVREIKTALIEATRIYCDLVNGGLPLDCLDVGGGLAVDYTGNRNTQKSSMNYSLQEYANDVVYYVQSVCNQSNVAHPRLYSESGRALVAHHSILVVPVVGCSMPVKTETIQSSTFKSFPESESTIAERPIKELEEILSEFDGNRLSEHYHDAQQALQSIHQSFANGLLSLHQRATGEQLYQAICQAIQLELSNLDFVPDDLISMRNDSALTYVANFSVFQSLPDSWAIGNLFPIVPIHRLDERPREFGRVVDITCDSDGCIQSFPAERNPQSSLPLHHLKNGQKYCLGVFLVGAYQEVLGDDHNLFGKVHTVIVDRRADSNQLEIAIRKGSNLNQVLSDVHHDTSELLEQINRFLDAAVHTGSITEEQACHSKTMFRQSLEEFTYLDSSGHHSPGRPAHLEKSAIKQSQESTD